MATKHTRSFDILSVPWLFGANYFLMFGLSAIDAIFDLGHSSYRLRDVFVDFHGVSPMALAYVWLGYCLFVSGYSLPAGREIANLIQKGFPFISRRSSFVGQRRFFIYTVLLFGLTFPVLVLSVQRFGAGRIAGAEEFDPSLSYYYVAGEIAFVIYALGVWQFMLSKRRGANKMPKAYTLFVWGCMFALQIIFSVWLGSRTRLMTVLLVAVLAYHYGYRRIRARFALVVALVLVAFVMPIVAWQRETTGESPTLDSVSAVFAWGWDSIMKHYSALEGFTVTFEDLDSAPQPDPLWTIFASGLIPRLLWSDKPFSVWSDRFSFWATGFPSSAFFPSLPGEMLLHFGYIGALMAMMVLGILWRTAFTFFIGSEKPPSGSGFIYIVLLSQAVSQLEVGFVIPYGALLRNAAISFVLFFIVSASRSKVMRTAAAQSRHSTQPVTGPPHQARS